MPLQSVALFFQIGITPCPYNLSHCFFKLVLPDAMALSLDTIALFPDAMALLPDTIALFPDAMALFLDTIELFPDAMALLPDA